MKRREWLGLLAAGLLRPPTLRGRRRRRRHAEWEFRLDRAQRWSLVHREGAAAVAGAEIAVRLAGSEAIPLGALADVRRFELTSQGDTTGWQVVGRLAGVEIAAQFVNGPPPVVAVTARGLADEQALTEIRFFDTGSARVAGLAAGGRPAAGRPAAGRQAARVWINGAASASDCRVIPADGTVPATSHWQLAVLPPEAGAARTSARGLALAFGPADAGDGRFAVGEQLVAASWFGERPLGMTLPPASASLWIVPSAEPLDALGRLVAGPPSGTRILAGWTSEHVAAGGATEEELLATLGFARRRWDPEAFRYILLDDGYQRSVGDWDTNDRFPRGHRWLTDQIHAAGFRAGLWLAPFAVAERSGIPTAHPEWLLQTPAGEPLVVAQRDDWGGRVFALDASQAPVCDYLRELARHAVQVWGYDLLKLGALGFGAEGTRRGRRVSHAEAYRAGLRALREGATTAFVLGCDAPLQHSAGLVDGMRVTPNVAADFSRLVPAARSLLLRAHLGGTAWVNDADAILVGGSLTDAEARAWASLVALSGGTALASENLGALPDARLAILQRVLPVAPVRGRALDVAAPEWTGVLQDAAPGWVLAQVRDDWWMLAAINWDEVPRQVSLSLGEHGVRGPLAAYDVWEGTRLADVRGRVALSLPPHACTVLSLRRPRRTPFVIGSTRHLVQGVMDLADEHWDAGRGILSARALLLDERPYEVTIALPPGFHPEDATSDPAAEIAVEVVERGAARLTLARPPAAEVTWSVIF